MKNNASIQKTVRRTNFSKVKAFILGVVKNNPSEEFSTTELLSIYEGQKGRTLKANSLRLHIKELHEKGLIDKCGDKPIYIKNINQKSIDKAEKRISKPKIKYVKKEPPKVFYKTPNEVIEISDRIWSCPEKHFNFERNHLKVDKLSYYVCICCKCAYHESKWKQYPIKAHNLKDLFFSIIDIHPEFLKLLKEKRKTLNLGDKFETEFSITSYSTIKS